MKKLLLLLPTIFLMGCQSPFFVKTDDERQRETLVVNAPSKPRLYPVKVEAVAMPDGKNVIVVNEQSYKNWLRNNKNMERYILQAEKIIKEYKAYYAREKKDV